MAANMGLANELHLLKCNPDLDVNDNANRKRRYADNALYNVSQRHFRIGN